MTDKPDGSGSWLIEWVDGSGGVHRNHVTSARTLYAAELTRRIMVEQGLLPAESRVVRERGEYDVEEDFG